ncbi:MAG: hypothetical protein D6691_05325 [Candidatus Hydrogenedentota bacterium]|uniref:Uncharacterized protein n=1 Tax=Sumerlaea chitinivorans TaxID=2250252 RepID=A0A2Z4Y530_SUMC1|nr:hypothetical protein BRCON_1289 [Candidatus Sumerlaea chitinivorans]MCX7964715.1 tetratricopeptide repeat protein [Candidatus Sumerlaea chitinivorans]RMH27882.1 MAG: hypothetical protein D6691_05325 [Candidatus Hydrogenedentota bacterium]GIX45698.1 MAG: hypothetical protein KatS3mg130_2106 [Candidatus Sumerlaea sp.]
MKTAEPNDIDVPTLRPDPTLIRRVLLLVGSVALVVRLAYYYELSTKPYFGAPLLDSRWWFDAAQRWAQGSGLGPESLFRPPLYTLFLGVLYKLAGSSALILAPLIQLMLGAAFCVLIAFLGIQCGTFAGGVAAGLLAALYGPLVFYEAEVLNDTVFLFLLTAFLVLFLRSLEATSIRPALYVGLLGGLAAITRPNALLICGPMIVAGVIVLFRRRLNSFPIVWLLAACLPFSILVGMPTLYNVRKGDPALICTQGGINFWIGNNPSANGTNVTLPKLTEQGNEYRDTVEEYAKLGYFVDQYGTQQGLLRFYAGDPAPRPSELSAYWYRKALRYLLEHPWEAARLYARKLIALFNNHEVRNNRDFGFARANESLVLRLLPVNYALVLALAILGLTHAGVRRSPKLRWLLLYMGLAGVSVLMFFVAGRLRLPLLPPLFIFAGLGVEFLGSALANRAWLNVAKSVALVLLVGSLSCYAWPQIDFRWSDDQPLGTGIRATGSPAAEWVLLAIASLENKHPAEAEAYAEKAIAADSNLALAYLVLGNASLARGNLAKAAESYMRAIQVEPAGLRAYNNLAVVCEKLQLFQEAAELYLHVLRANPSDVRASANLAMLLMRNGDRVAARTFAEQALEGAPQDAAARAVIAFFKQGESTASSPDLPKEVSHMLAELAQPIPGRLDLTSTRPLTQVFDRVTSTILTGGAAGPN